MTTIEYIHTDLPLKDRSLNFKEVPPRQSKAKWNIPFLELKRYHILSPMWSDGRWSLERFLDMVREHLRRGAKKFYYAVLWEGYDPDEKNPEMRKMDLADIDPYDESFDFGHHTIWEFVDPGTK